MNLENRDTLGTHITVQLIKPEKMPSFTGARSEITAFGASLRSMRQELKERGAAEPDATLLTRMSAAMTTPATQIWYNSIISRQHPPPPKTIEDLLKELKESWGERIGLLEKEGELDKVIQQPHQSVSEYAQCKIAKAIEVGVGREDLGLHRSFINHLASDRIKRDVHRKFEKTTRKGGVLSWEELVEKAKEEESYYKGPMEYLEATRSTTPST